MSYSVCSIVFRSHNERISVKKGSFFHDSNLTLEQFSKVIYWWSRQSSVTHVNHETGVSKPVVVDIFQYLREITCVVMIENGEPIGGLEEEAELDESKFGSMKYNKVSCCFE